MCGEAVDTGSLFSRGSGKWHKGYTGRSCEEGRESGIEALGPCEHCQRDSDPLEGENWLYTD